MKKVIYLLILLNIALPAQVIKNEWINPWPAPHFLYDIFFLDSLTGWSVGEFSTALKTTDGGKNWTQLEIPFRAVLHRVFFADENNGWIAGGDPSVPLWGAILKTTDGGKSWKNFQPNPAYDYAFLDISMPTKTTGYIAGFEGIFKTTNSGDDWFNTGGIGWATSVFFIDSNTGWATGPEAVLKTTDGAKKWSIVSNFHWGFNKRIKFLDSQIGWVVGGGMYDHYAVIHKTTDGGSNWILQDSIVNSTFYDIEILDSLNVIAVGEGGLARYTTDGGSLWLNANVGETSHFGIGLKNKSVFIVGGKYYFPTINEAPREFLSWKRVSRLVTIENLKGISLGNKNFGFITGAKGTLLVTTDAGVNWQNKNLFNFDLDDVSMPDETNIFIAGSSGELIKSSDGGKSWNLKNIRGSLYTPHRIEFFSALNGISYPERDAIMKTGDGGETWSIIAEFADGSFFADSLNGWLFINPMIISSPSQDDCCGIIRKTTDGGLTWSADIPVETSVRQIFFLDKDNGWYTNWNQLYRTHDGGATWERISSDPFYSVTQMLFISPEEGFFIGGDSFGVTGILKTTDGGLTFHFMKRFTFLSKLYFKNNVLYGIGDSGEIIRFTDFTTGLNSDNREIPLAFSLSQNYPNPFNPTTKIKYALSVPGYVQLKIYDMLGNEVSTLIQEEKPAGKYEIEFDASSLSSGVYFYRLQSGSFSETKKLLFLK